MTHTEELELIRQQNGGILRPSDVVEFARNPDTALHSKFTWDDTTAAHQYRLWQAREIIRVVVTVPDRATEPMRVYVSLTDDRQEDGGGYRTLTEVMRKKDMRAALLSQAHDDMDRFQTKYRQIEELAGVMTAMRTARRLTASASHGVASLA